MAEAAPITFEQAAEKVQKLPKKPDDKTLLELYGLFKQANEGDVNTKRPDGTFDFKGKAKWDAWKGVIGTTQEDAKKQYVALAEKLLAEKESSQ